MENLKKSTELLEAILDSRAFDKETGLIWDHWLDQISKQVDLNNLELSNQKLVGINYIVRDWMSAEVYEFSTCDEAMAKFDEIFNDTKDEECDLQLYKVLKEFNNIK